MRIVVLSDTHGNYLSAMQAVAEASPVDLIVHLGDDLHDATLLGHLTDIPIIKVPGNCDHAAGEALERAELLAGQIVFMTHGDRYNVKSGLAELREKGLAEEARIVLYGHTHLASVLEVDGMLLVNPGTLISRSRLQSYALLTLTEGTAKAEIIHL